MNKKKRRYAATSSTPKASPSLCKVGLKCFLEYTQLVLIKTNQNYEKNRSKTTITNPTHEDDFIPISISTGFLNCDYGK